MSSKFEGRSDLIDDLVESPSSPYPKRIITTRNYSSLPSSLNKTEYSPQKSTNELRDRLHFTLPRSNPSSILMNNDERRKEIDSIIKHLYEGKLLTAVHDDQSPIDYSEPVTSTINKHEKGSHKNLELLSPDGDLTSLQRELQEREFDIIHLRKEIQELQMENKLFQSKTPTVYSNNNQEIDAIRREKVILQNELRSSQELITKLQHQQQQNTISNRSKQIDELALHQKEALEKKIKTYENQMRILMHENEKFKRYSLQTEGLIEQLKRENDDLQQKLTEIKKRNDELFYQEFHALRNDLKMLKQRNNELFDENLRLQQQRPHSDPKYRKVERSVSPNHSEASDSTNYLATVSVEHYNTRPSTSVYRSLTTNGNNSHHTTRYNSNTGHEELNQNKGKLIDQQFTHRSPKPKRAVGWDEDHIHSNEDVLNHDDVDDSKPSFSQTNQSNYSMHRSVTLNESPHHSRRTLNHDDRRSPQKRTETVSPRRPYAPTSISDVHMNDVVKFSRPGGKISKGVVKYIGSLPDKNDHYLGLELEDEESKHDGVYQDQRFFHCKPNKGVFVAFNKVIMAWCER